MITKIDTANFKPLSSDSIDYLIILSREQTSMHCNMSCVDLIKIRIEIDLISEEFN